MAVCDVLLDVRVRRETKDRLDAGATPARSTRSRLSDCPLAARERASLIASAHSDGLARDGRAK